MSTRDMTQWETAICKVVSKDGEEEIVVRGHRLSELVGTASFAETMFLMLQGRMPTPGQAHVLDALLVASIEHGIAPPSMISRCFASYGTSIQAAVGSGIAAFGDRMGGLGEQLARLMAEHLAPWAIRRRSATSDYTSSPAPSSMPRGKKAVAFRVSASLCTVPIREPRGCWRWRGSTVAMAPIVDWPN
jgi:citrate synthase